ncbi:MAG: hypothetical protein ACLQUY_07175 [Ktedonobacterales bacterium]
MSLQWFPAQPVRLAQLVHNAPFPVYGLADTPDDLMLHGVRYSTVGAGWGDTTPRSSPPPLDGPQYLCQVDLSYGSTPAYGAWLERLEVRTTAVTQSPAEAPEIGQLRQTVETHYSSDEDVPLLDSQQSLRIEHFRLVDRYAVAAVKYSPDPMPRSGTPGVVMGRQRHELAGSPKDVPIPVPAPPPTWSFTFRASEMWVDVQAYGWPQQDIFEVLHHLVALNDRADVVARSHRQVITWEQAIGWRRDENEV